MANNQGIVDPALIAQKQINTGNKLTNIGGIIGGLGALADTINGIVQASRGRTPIPIGAPLQAIGGTVGNIGAQKLALGQKNTALAGINSVQGLDPALKSLAMAGINAGESGSAIKGAFDVLAAQPKLQANEDYRQSLLSLKQDQMDFQKEQEDRRIRALEDQEKSKILPFKKDADQVVSVQSTLGRLQTTLNSMDSGRVGGFSEKTKGLISNPKLKTYDTQKGLLLSNISRNLGGEKGVLTDQDIERITAGFPSIYDTVAERNSKFSEINSLINTRLEQHLQNAYSINPTLAEQIFKGTNYKQANGQQSTQQQPASIPQGMTKEEAIALAKQRGLIK